MENKKKKKFPTCNSTERREDDQFLEKNKITVSLLFYLFVHVRMKGLNTEHRKLVTNALIVFWIHVCLRRGRNLQSKVRIQFPCDPPVGSHLACGHSRAIPKPNTRTVRYENFDFSPSGLERENAFWRENRRKKISNSGLTRRFYLPPIMFIRWSTEYYFIMLRAI